jgi:predicted ribosome quality control (RQC) complex YloA/Tae2 family protein
VVALLQTYVAGMECQGEDAALSGTAVDAALLAELAVARKAATRWARRQQNALARLPDPSLALAEADRLERITRSLLAHRDRIRPGAVSVRIPDYGAEGVTEVEVALDPAQSFESLTRARFHKATKLRRAAAAHGERVAALGREGEEAAAWGVKLAELCEQLEHPGPESVKILRRVRKEAARDLARLRQRLLPRGLWPQAPRPKEETPPSAPIRWDLPGGWVLWAGRSGSENDLLTTRVARADDLWFHAAHVPGSHVILRSPGAKPMPAPSELVELAAGVAAWLSKLRAQDVAEVHCTEKRHVRKPRKAPVGTVTMDHAKLLRVKPVPPP